MTLDRPGAPRARSLRTRVFDIERINRQITLHTRAVAGAGDRRRHENRGSCLEAARHPQRTSDDAVLQADMLLDNDAWPDGAARQL